MLAPPLEVLLEQVVENERAEYQGTDSSSAESRNSRSLGSDGRAMVNISADGLTNIVIVWLWVIF